MAISRLKEHGICLAFHLRMSSRNTALRLESGKMIPEPEVKSGGRVGWGSEKVTEATSALYHVHN